MSRIPVAYSRLWPNRMLITPISNAKIVAMVDWIVLICPATPIGVLKVAAISTSIRLRITPADCALKEARNSEGITSFLLGCSLSVTPFSTISLHQRLDAFLPRSLVPLSK